MADKLYNVSSVNVQLKHSEELIKCIHNSGSHESDSVCKSLG